MNAVYILSGLGIFSLLSEIFNIRKVLFPIVLLGLAAAALLLIMDWNSVQSYYSNMLTFDNYAVAFSAGISIVALLWFMMSKDYFENNTHVTDHFALVLFSLVGAVFMVSYSNLAMLFLGIEILSISLYILAGSKMKDLFSNEAAFKYFLMGSFATGFLLFGIALVYGVTGSFDLNIIAETVAAPSVNFPSLLYAGVLMMMVGLAFKISAVPFHFWAPDVYEGSPTVVTAFMSTIVKIAAFAAFFRLFSTCFAAVSSQWVDVVQVITVLTLVVSNITAVYQNSVKRMLAFSSVAHAGYMLITLVALNEVSDSAILYYVVSYATASIAAFTILHNVAFENENVTAEAFNGLVKRNPFMAFTMTVALLSLAGIPPLAGFFAKYYIFTVAFESGYVGLVLLAILTSLIGIYYYFRIIIAMYLKSSDIITPIETPLLHRVLMVICLLASIILGVAPDLIIRLI
ncbi:NADH-quinone oxidoreductase subunit N [Fulvivirgaceae bacterium PWU4]|uniref:NADH-quinone oxidoreductase subunit N n=1 Tax=Chryseosolibacter histidini TaxID=2782349 RepID=A0AAP2DM41_9BACT|nr:NADH-quinone oxidoreductase subunit N [Chryseosolibacter histidini]MBT1697999.1 NADH-quinone oxidoreductase subunit N [Chryseosolibacter histidini]